ncbi:MAG: SdiA-regulated domain-containing protein, partial [Ginsengibacter sp.]
MNFNAIIFYIGIFIFSACNANSNKRRDPVIVELPPKNVSDSSGKTTSALNNYDVKNPNHTWKLPAELIEVSGNTWIDKDHLILIEDLHPSLYYIKIDDTNATLEKTIPFAEQEKEKVDIEDVTYVNDTVYALWSHGILFKINDWHNKPVIEKIKTPLKKENNTEGLCYDPVTKKLLIACKDASGLQDEKKSSKAVYEFDLNKNTLDSIPFLVIHKTDFEKITGDKIAFNPSAIAVHPITHDVYILTTRANKGMAVYSHDGVIKSYQEIDKDLMPQPEGICFSPEGKLYISSEGKKGEPGNL